MELFARLDHSLLYVEFEVMDDEIYMDYLVSVRENLHWDEINPTYLLRVQVWLLMMVIEFVLVVLVQIFYPQQQMHHVARRYLILNNKLINLSNDILFHEVDNSYYFDYYSLVRMKLFQPMFGQLIHNLQFLIQ
jgi:hypothetical protein